MSYRPRVLLAAAGIAALVACSDQSASTAPATDASLAVSPAASGPGGSSQLIKMRDDCDSVSFNAALGPGSCTKRGSVSFDEFIAELEKTQKAGAWKNNPDQFAVRVGTTLSVTNIGGEAHTFTHVAKFGGGIVELLNDLSGNPVPAPECAQLVPTDFVPSGGSFTIPTGGRTGLRAGTHNYQCCIHPWMRTTATLK